MYINETIGHGTDEFPGCSSGGSLVVPWDFGNESCLFVLCVLVFSSRDFEFVNNGLAWFQIGSDRNVPLSSTRVFDLNTFMKFDSLLFVHDDAAKPANV